MHGIDGTEPEPTPVDKTALKSALDTANGLDARRYTAASWAEFQQIIDAAQAVYDDVNATEEQVAEQVTKLEDGQKVLVALATDVEKSTLPGGHRHRPRPRPLPASTRIRVSRP